MSNQISLSAIIAGDKTESKKLDSIGQLQKIEAAKREAFYKIIEKTVKLSQNDTQKKKKNPKVLS